MRARTQIGAVFCVLVVVAVLAGTATGAATGGVTSHVSCTASPEVVEPGEPVVLDASDTEADVIDFDINGNGEYDQRDMDDFIIEVAYDQEGTYEPVARADEDPDSTASCGTVYVGVQPPTANLTLSPNPAREDDTVVLNASGSSDPNGEITQYRWDLNGDEEIDRVTEVDTIEEDAYTEGQYTPTVTVVDNDEWTDSESKELTVDKNQPPTADFTVTPNPAKEGETVTFDASASDDPDGSIVEYRWDFDGNEIAERTTDTAIVETSYDTPDNYVPIVTVVDNDSATGDATTDLTIEENQPPTANLSTSPNPGKVGETVNFDASGSSDPDGTIETYRWDFDGDGTVDQITSSATTSTTYDAAGNYVPTVIVEDDNGAGSEALIDLTIEENDPPAVELSVSPNPAEVGETVTFDASGSFDSDGTIVEYRWDFDGDGTREQTTELATTENSYDTANDYTPAVTVVDNDSATATASQNLLVEEPVSTVCRAEPMTAGVDEAISLNASASNATFVEFDIDGDGEYERGDETDFIVEVRYAEEGTYEAFARADNDPETRVSCGEITIQNNEPPTASFEIGPRPGTVGQPATFDASSSSDPEANITEYRWDFDNDGQVDQTVSEPVTEFTYDQPGSYVPSLTVVDGGELTAEDSTDYIVERQSSAVCRAEPRTVGVDEPVTLDASGSDATFVEFDVDGDGEYERGDETDFIVEVRYAEEGTYTPVARANNNPEETAPCGEITVQNPEPPRVEFDIDPQPGTAGQPVTFDASGSFDPDGELQEYRWDFDNDGQIDQTVLEPVTEFTYDQAGNYVPSLTVVDNDGLEGEGAREFRVDAPATVVCRAEPRTVAVDETVTLDATGSEARFVEFGANGDGTYDDTREAELVLDVAYSEPGTYEPVVRANGEGGPTASCGEVVVEEPEGPTASLNIDPRPGTVGETVSFDASASSAPSGIVEYRWDFDGDGSVEETTTTPTTEYTYNQSGSYRPALTVVDENDQEATAAKNLTVESTGPLGDIPLVPLGIGGGGALGGLGLLYYFLGGGGAAAGGGAAGGGSGTVPKPKPGLGGGSGPQYETGVFSLPARSGTFTVSVGFRPDILTFRAANGARTDAMIDRTAGWSRGVVVQTDDGQVSHSLTVADDAHSNDQSTAAVSDDTALGLLRHRDDRPPARIELRVTETTNDGFEVAVTVPGDDPVVGGIRVLFTAFGTDSETTAELGFARTPTTPGTQTVEPNLTADYVSLSASTAVSDTNSLWTTDRSTALSLGQAVTSDEGLSQVTAGVSTWPGTGDNNGAFSDRGAIGLLYQDGDGLAGRTTAAITNVGETIRLRYDRVYNGPHKLGSTAKHPLSYLALSTEEMRPAVGQFTLPTADRSQSIDCGFEPALIELTIVPASPGERTADAASTPFGWSQGTAIARDNNIRQYVVQHSVAPEEVPPISEELLSSDISAGQTATDGGAPDPTEFDPDTLPEVQPVDLSKAEPPREPTAYDDGRAGLWLPADETSAVSGRSELRVTETTETGFSVAVRSVDATTPETTARPTVIYTAWPAAKEAGGTTVGPAAGYDQPVEAGPIDDQGETTDTQEDNVQE